MEATDKDSGENATQGSTVATGTTDACHDQESFPFMKLPPELRLMVYNFALRDIVDPILFPPSGEAQKPQPYRGALALLHASKLLRGESWYAMWNNAYRYSNIIDGIYMAALQRTCEVGDLDSVGSPAWQQAQDRFKHASRQDKCIALIIDVLTKVMVAYWDDRVHQHQFKKDIATHDPVVRHEANE